jgi:hypothetical protein
MISPAFLSVSPTAIARSPLERAALAAGAELEDRDGWSVVVTHPDTGFADRSHIRKCELPGDGGQGSQGGQLGLATRDDSGAWWCPVTPARTLVLGAGEDAELPDGGLDVTCAYAAIELLGPDCAEVLARFCALDARPQSLPVGAFRPGSIARTPGHLLRTGEESMLLLVGWALGEYLYEVVVEAIGRVAARKREARVHDGAA